MYEPKSRFLVYSLLDPRTGDVRYIGKSSSGMRRPQDHQRPSGRTVKTHNGAWLRQLWADGERVPLILVLEECDSEAQALAREIVLIALFREAGFNLTNLTDGGDGVRGYKLTDEDCKKRSARLMGHPVSQECIAKRKATMAAHGPYVLTDEQKRRKAEGARRKGDAMIGGVRSEETRRKISETKKSRVYVRAPVSDATRAKLSAALKGKKRTEEQRRRLSEARKGYKPTEEARQHMAEAQMGRKLSEETKAKIAASNRRRKLSPETKAKIGAGNRGRHPSPDVIAKISKSSKAKWADPDYKARVLATRAETLAAKKAGMTAEVDNVCRA